MTPLTAPRIVAVIPHFYAERIPSLWQAVEALQTQLLPPVAILVWDNGMTAGEIPPAITEAAPAVYLLRSRENLGPGARFLAARGALWGDATHVYFQDNDVVLPPTGLSELHLWSVRTPGAVVALEGRHRKVDRPYQRWPKVYGSGLVGADPVMVDVVLGRADLVPVDPLRRILAELPSPPPQMDDLAFSAACSRLGIARWVVPGPALRNVQAGVGMCHDPDYYARRDAAVAELQWEAPRAV